MSTGKTYYVDTVYRHREVGLGIARNIERQARASASSLGMLQRTIGTFGAGAAGYFGMGKLKGAFIDFNAGLEDAQVKMAGLSTMNLGGSLEDHWKRAELSLQRYQEMAKRSSLTTRDLVDMAGNIQQPVMQAGGTMDQLEKFTFGAANAAKAFGIHSEVASFDIQQMLAGTVTIRDRFAKAILSQKGIEIDYEKFNKLSGTARLSTVERALNSPAIKQMAERQANTFSGVTSTLQDNIQMLAGKVGLPLFKRLTAEVKNWNEWLDKNQDKVDAFAKSLADGLVTGFGYVKDAVGFIVDNRDTLISIGKVWAAVKIGGAAGGMLGGVLGAGAGRGAGGVAAVGLGGWQLGRELVDKIGRDKVTDAMSDLADAFGFGNKAIYDNVRSFERHDAALAAAEKRVRSGNYVADHDSAIAAKLAAIAVDRDQLAALKELQAAKAGYRGDDTSDLERGALSAFGLGMLPGVLDAATPERMRLSAAEERAKKLGIDTNMPDAGSMGLMIRNLEDKLETNAAYERKISTINEGHTAVASTAVNDAMAELSASQRLAVDKSELLRVAMETLAKGMANGDNLAVGPMAEAIRAALVAQGIVGDAAAANRENKKTPGTRVTINKVEVSAKDPDRWISKLDEALARKTAAPTQAKRARGRTM